MDLHGAGTGKSSRAAPGGAEGVKMGVFDNGFRLGTGLMIGVGAIILTPVVLPVVVAVAKPLIKAGIKGGMMLVARGREMVAEATEVMEDIVAEAKAELSQERCAGASTTPAVDEAPDNDS
jgi:hypothetical protein